VYQVAWPGGDCVITDCKRKFSREYIETLVPGMTMPRRSVEPRWKLRFYQCEGILGILAFQLDDNWYGAEGK
jgi:hypothetical protein